MQAARQYVIAVAKSCRTNNYYAKSLNAR